MFVMLLVAATPTLVLNAPVGLAAMAWARWRQRAALANSDVKVHAFDVLLSEKLKFALVAVPLLWLSYAALLLLATPLSLQDVLTLLMVMPIASYIGVVSTESGMIALHDLRPMLARLMYDTKRVEALKKEQGALRDIVHAEVRGLVESDETISKMFHTQGTLTTSDWERLRAPKGTSPKREATAGPQGFGSAAAQPGGVEVLDGGGAVSLPLSLPASEGGGGTEEAGSDGGGWFRRRFGKASTPKKKA